MVAATLLIAVITASLLGSGCIGGGDDGAQQSMKLQIAGSTTVLPIAEECARVFMEARPGDRVFVSGGGSSHGVKAVADGTMDIGTASRDLTDSEMEAHPDLAVHAIARDGIAIVVHPENPVDGLTMAQLQGIYTGEITDWKDVGGEDSEIAEVSSEGIISDIVKFFNFGEDSSIMVVSREEGSGTRGYFEDAVMKSTGKEITDHAIIQDSNGKIRTTVAGDKHSIGFLSLGYASSDVKTVALASRTRTRRRFLISCFRKMDRRSFWMCTTYLWGNPLPLFYLLAPAEPSCTEIVAHQRLSGQVTRTR